MEIKELVGLLPKDYEKEWYEKKAIKRKRMIKNPLDLIILLLYYLYDNHFFTNEELFFKGVSKWVGGSTLGSYFVSTTVSHYDWAIKKRKAHKKNCAAV